MEKSKWTGIQTLFAICISANDFSNRDRPFRIRITMSASDEVIAVIVTYHPESERLGLLLDSLKCQVTRVVVVDNGSSPDIRRYLADRKEHNIHCLLLGSNLGIAAAQNAGIAWAQERDGNYVLLMDQDSVPQTEMVEELLQTYLRLKRQNIKVAAVGSRYKDGADGQLSGFVRFSGRTGSRAVSCRENQQEVECDFVIASGSLIPLSVIDDVGGMDEGFFIDHVDTEWCLRTRSKGYKIYGACLAVMHHELGSNRIPLWFIRWRSVSVHAPFRYYYMVRNSVLLHRRDYPDRAWRLFDMQRLLQVFVFFGLFLPGRAPRLRMMWKGFRDGMRGVTGKFND